MTVPLSPHKASKILRDYFHGLPQTRLAKDTGVDQSSISHYASRFKEMAAEYGLTAAAKEYRVMNEVESLRSLSVELYKSKLTVDEARQGHDIAKAFLKLGISQEQHHNLVEICQKVADSGFVEAALQLSQIETQTGMSYNQVMSNFNNALNQLPHLEGNIAEAKVDLKAVSDRVLRTKQELACQEEYLKKYQHEVKAKKSQLEKELSARMKQLEVDKKEVEEAATLKAECIKKGINIKTLLKLAKEFQHGS